jgi:transposase-like protein
MGRPPSAVAEYHQWKSRLEKFQTSEESLDMFCLQEGVSRSTFYRWKRRLDEGILESVEGDSADSQHVGLTESLFQPISLKSARVEIELPNGGVLRLPSDVSKEMLVAVTRVVGSLRPWKAPQS